MLDYRIIYVTLGSADYRKTTDHLIASVHGPQERGFHLEFPEVGQHFQCCQCRVPIPSDHMALVKLGTPAEAICWECGEAEFLSVEPDAVVPQTLDQFRDTGERP